MPRTTTNGDRPRHAFTPTTNGETSASRNAFTVAGAWKLKLAIAVIGGSAVLGAALVTGQSTVEGARQQANGTRAQASAVRYAANIKAGTDLTLRLLAACQATKQPCHSERVQVDKLRARVENK